jgi:hypothetical protein
VTATLQQLHALQQQQQQQQQQAGSMAHLGLHLGSLIRATSTAAWPNR